MRFAYYIILGAVCFAVVWRFTPFYTFSRFDHFERRAKKAIAAEELQKWATNVIGQFSTNSDSRIVRLSELGTNFPSQLRRLWRYPPYVEIMPQRTNYDACVFLMWGGGVLGHCGFEIGSTNFVSYREHARAWQPGVYFWSEYPQK